MARHTKAILIDDIDGTRADETVIFALDGTAYEIDLSEDRARELRDAFAPFVGRARRVRVELRGRARPGRARSDGQALRLSRELSADIRRWAREHDFRISDRGRIPTEVVQAYQKAH